MQEMANHPARIAAIGAVACLTGLAIVASTSAATPTDRATGTYTYTTTGPRSVSLDAHGSDPVKGTWTLASGARSGPVTCLVVQGADAFIYGPPAAGGDRAAFFWVHDEGTPGTAGDMAVTWVQDLPGEVRNPYTRAEMEDWCRNAGDGFPAGLYPLDSGNLTVFDAP
jgi:hypothetical protein